MDLGAANRKLSNRQISRLCRLGSVIKSQGIEVILYFKASVPAEMVAYLIFNQMTKKGGTVKASLSSLQEAEGFLISLMERKTSQ